MTTRLTQALDTLLDIVEPLTPEHREQYELLCRWRDAHYPARALRMRDTDDKIERRGIGAVTQYDLFRGL
jgi:hypothetical protein